MVSWSSPPIVAITARIDGSDQAASAGRRTRLRFSAAATSRSRASSADSIPHRSIALTSMCDASQGPISDADPVRMLTTPPGRSEVAITSPSVTAGSGRSYDETATTVLPETIAGAITLVSPSRLESCGARTATTPVASGNEKSKYGPATGLVEPTTWASLSAQPAYQTQRSIDASTSARALLIDNPSDAATSELNCSCRP